MAKAKEPEQQEEAAPEPSDGKSVKLKYNGPAGQMNQAIGHSLVPGESYEVPAELAERLKASSPFWE